MTKKRFTLKHYEDTDWAYDNGKSIYTKEMVDLLNEQEETIKTLTKENEELKEILGAILLEVKRDITVTNQTGEIKVFINPNSYEKISEILRKYGALKGWYNE